MSSWNAEGPRAQAQQRAACGAYSSLPGSAIHVNKPRTPPGPNAPGPELSIGFPPSEMSFFRLET